MDFGKSKIRCMQELLGSKPECDHCPIFQYEISRQMLLVSKSGVIYQYHSKQIEYLTGKKLETYPKLPQLCTIFCAPPLSK